MIYSVLCPVSVNVIYDNTTFVVAMRNNNNEMTVVDLSGVKFGLEISFTF